MDSRTSIVSADKIIEKSKQWSLEGDCTLLQWMDQISKNLEDRVTKTSSALNDLSTKLDRTSVALSNATNNLAALQYSQFVENRVHDDDETLANAAEVPNPVADVTDKGGVNQNIYLFLKKNLEMMNSCHEAYSISYDDSDEDEPATNVVYRSKNPYEARSLPHIYGSNLWKEKWHIGLCDSDNDFSGDENSEQFSESSSTEDDSYESTAPTMSEWDSTAWGLNKNHLAEREEIHTPSNDGESLYQGENYSQSEVSTPRAQMNLPISQPIQDQRYYQHIPRKEDNIFDDIFSDLEQKVVTQEAPQVGPPPQKKISAENLITNDPPPDVPAIESDNNRLIGAKKPLNLFDDDEFSSFMDQIVQTATNKNTRSCNLPEEKQEPPKKTLVPNIFDDSEDIFTPKVSEPPRKKEVEANVEDDIFMPPPLPTVVEKIRTRNLFDDDDDDDDFESIFASKPSGSNKFTQKTKNLFEDDLGDLDVKHSDKNLVPEQEKVSTPLTNEATITEISFMKKGLFDDDEDDLEKEEDVFARKPIKKDFFEDVFSKSPRDNVIENVSALNNDLFTEVVQVEISKEVTDITKKQELSVKEKAKTDQSNSNASSLTKTDLFTDVFEDKPTDDIFASSSDEKKTKVADIFADDFTDDFEEFIPRIATSKTKNESGEKEEIPSDTKPTADAKLPIISQKPNVPMINKESHDEVKANTIPKLPDIARKPTISVTEKKAKDEVKLAPEKVDQSVEVVVTEKLQNEIVPSSLNEGSTTTVEAPTNKKDVTPTLFENKHISKVSPRIKESDENPPEDNKQQTIAVPSYTSLFQDEPPPDDEDLITTSYDEPPKYTVDEDVMDTSPPIAPYSNINLFADVPPDDDFPSVLPTETKRIHSIFYDDFHETIEASREMRAPSTYIFNEEPPPDDDLQITKVGHEEKPKVVEEKKDKPKVSKLKKTDLQINVGALLPTAKIPSFKKPEIVLDSASGSPKYDVPTKTSIIKPSQKRDLPENILPNLNRDRAKVQVKRRPSTRKGRQDSYRKSMIQDEIVAAEQVQDDDNLLEKDLKQKPTSLFEDFRSFDVKKPNTGESIASEEVFNSRTTIAQLPGRDLLFESDVSVEKSEANLTQNSFEEPRISKIPFLLEDTVTEIENVFETLRPNKDRPETTPADSLFANVDENPFGSPTKSFAQSIPSIATIETAPQSLAKKQITSASATSASLFDESDSTKEKQSLVAPPTKTPLKTQITSKLTTSASLFDDSDSAEEKQFLETPSTKTPLKSTKELVKSSAKPSSLFGESDDGSDDLFKESIIPKKPPLQKTVEKKPKPKAVSQPAKLSSSLFSSDEESASGDDIFGKSKIKIVPKKIEAAKTKASSNLFADLSDDDDDDLFGTTKKKPYSGEKLKTKPSKDNLQPTKISPLTQQQTATSNNPLSDLLGP